jgi:type 1 fimbria pilin
MKTLKMALAITALGTSSLALANTGTITINGKIYNETCILSGGSNATGTTNVTVTLDTIPSSNFTASARTSGLKNFDVTLTKPDGTTACYTSALGSSLAPVVTLSTAAAADYSSTETTALVNKAGTKSTTNPVFVQILAKPNSSGAGTIVDYSNTSTQAKATNESATNKFYYAAQYYAGAGSTIPAAQDVNAVVTYNITYP